MSKVRKFFISTFIFLFLFGTFGCMVYAESTGPAVVTGTNVNLRSGPGTTNKIVGRLNKGQSVNVLTASGSWYKIKTSSGATTWVSKEYVSLQSASTKSTSTSVSRGDFTRVSLIDYSKKFLGVKYVWGGTTPKGFDCSGFVKYVYGHFSISLNRVASDQAKEGTYIKKENLQPGDLVFFDTNGGKNKINHVGIYIGGGKFIQSSSGKSAVVISDITKGFYAQTYMTAKRVI